MELKGKKALITGGALRLGRSHVLALANAGVDTGIHYHSSSREAEETAKEVRKTGSQAWLFPRDLSQGEGLDSWFQKVSRDMKGIDILINSAAVYPRDQWRDTTRESILKNLDINALAPLHLIRAFAAQGSPGVVINFLDTRILSRDPQHAAYHLSKRVLMTITKDLAYELAPSIRVNAIAPGLILPPRGRGESYMEKGKKWNPLQTRGTREHINTALLFLLQNDFVTGQILYVDGGYHLKGTPYSS